MVNKEELTEIVKQVISEYDKQQRDRAKRKRDRRLRNTDLLLRNYDNLISHIKQAVDTESKLEEIHEEEVFDELDNVEYDDSEEYDGIYINSVKRTKTRTKIIVKHIECALAFYKSKAKDPVHIRRYNVVYKYYCEKKKTDEIAKELEVNERTIWRDKSIAIEELSVLFFGIDGMKFRA